MSENTGVFVISLDFELYWGLRDKKSLEEYRENLLGVRTAVPALLQLFSEYGIHATWAVVGFLFFDTRQELWDNQPVLKPGYVNRALSPYDDIGRLGADEQEDPFHFAPSLIKKIISYPHQEIGSHSFSHYYCLEKGQDCAEFKADLDAAVRIAGKYDLSPESLVFPRNQVNPEYLPICGQLGIKAYRGNPSSWVYRVENKGQSWSWVRKGLRLPDAYVNLTGHNSFGTDSIARELPINIPASRFLRPYNKRLRIFEPLRLRRILNDLTYTAEKGQNYHLWWHPHNFGTNLEENLSFLKKILDHFGDLQTVHKMESLNMGELAGRLLMSVNANSFQ